VSTDPDLLCFSHLRWDFVYQRPQHLLSRFAQAGTRRVFFFEEPIVSPNGQSRPTLDISVVQGGVYRVVPRIGADRVGVELVDTLRGLLDDLVNEASIHDCVAWYYTPMALGFSRHLRPLATIYDCMDELSAFRGAPPDLLEREQELFERADLVFTGGPSLYESKRSRHPSVHLFPSSVDARHFGQARQPQVEPADQAAIPRPRLGFFGVLDERLDIDLLAQLADLRPDWQLVLIGPTVKIDPADLPRRPTIHYLGTRHYTELPAYLAGWDVALLPFARNEATRFISPTKTPEYLAAGCPVVSTSIRDVVRMYGSSGLVRIADDAPAFARAVEAALHEDRIARLQQADRVLGQMSWDRTWSDMNRLVEATLRDGSVGLTARPALVAS